MQDDTGFADGFGSLSPFTTPVLQYGYVRDSGGAGTSGGGGDTVGAERDFGIPAKVWLATLDRAVARHVRLPRSAKTGVAGSQHPRFIVENSPLELVRLKCEAAGMILQTPPVPPTSKKRRKSKNLVHTWRAMGPMSAYNFCNVQSFKKLGQGSAALMMPGKGHFESEVMTIAIPPITVKHVQNEHGWTAHVDLYLGVYNSNDIFTLPLRANSIYEGQRDPTQLFTKMARKVLAEMVAREMPVSRTFQKLLTRGEKRAGQAAVQSSESESETDSESETESESVTESSS